MWHAIAICANARCGSAAAVRAKGVKIVIPLSLVSPTLHPGGTCTRPCTTPSRLHSSLSPQYRWNVFKNIRAAIDQNEGGFEKFSQGEAGHHPTDLQGVATPVPANCHRPVRNSVALMSFAQSPCFCRLQVLRLQPRRVQRPDRYLVPRVGTRRQGASDICDVWMRRDSGAELLCTDLLTLKATV